MRCSLSVTAISSKKSRIVRRACVNLIEIFIADVNALPSSVDNSGVTVGAVVGSCVIGFFFGLALTAVLCFCYLKRRKPRIPGSPHYISKQNPYVTVPLKEVRLLLATISEYLAYLTRIFQSENLLDR
jgi:hypothetical protein